MIFSPETKKRRKIGKFVGLQFRKKKSKSKAKFDLEDSIILNWGELKKWLKEMLYKYEKLD